MNKYGKLLSDSINVHTNMIKALHLTAETVICGSDFVMYSACVCSLNGSVNDCTYILIRNSASAISKWF